MVRKGEIASCKQFLLLFQNAALCGNGLTLSLTKRSSHCDCINSSVTALCCFDEGYGGNQPVNGENLCEILGKTILVNHG